MSLIYMRALITTVPVYQLIFPADRPAGDTCTQPAHSRRCMHARWLLFFCFNRPHEFFFFMGRLARRPGWSGLGGHS
jgi:hypothetical protein